TLVKQIASEGVAAREAAELESSQKIEDLAPLGTEYIQVDFRKASDMLKHVQDAKLVSERGFIMADDETNILMVRETDAALAAIRNTLRKFDVEVQQVLIEARLVTATSSASKDLGVRWGVGSNTTNTANTLYGSSLNSLQDYQGNVVTSVDDGLAVDLGASSNVASTFAIGMKLGSSTLLGLELSALESDGKAEIISQPKILTMNGKTASIESGREIAYELTENGDTSIEYKDVVLRLEVTPRINPGDRIAMDLAITQDSIGDETVNGYITIDNNELNTSVVVPDGQTIVLGGVFQNETSETVFKTPLLGDIPVVGNLFKSRVSAANKSELLIFITPKLVRESLSIN
ncbi:MAG: type IV pilus secretin PilQ, partial [Pontibacterium sp.]